AFRKELANHPESFSAPEVLAAPDQDLAGGAPAGGAPPKPGEAGNPVKCRNRKVDASPMTYKPPRVTLPIPSEKIDGQTVTFRPVRDGIDSEVSGIIQVIEDANGFNVNASYVVSQDPPQSHIYWFDQSE